MAETRVCTYVFELGVGVVAHPHLLLVRGEGHPQQGDGRHGLQRGLPCLPADVLVHLLLPARPTSKGRKGVVVKKRPALSSKDAKIFTCW